MATIAQTPVSTKAINVAAIDKVTVMTPRLQRLKNARLENRTPVVSAERARLYRESWERTTGEHPAIRRAKAFKHFLENKEIVITPDEVLVGATTIYPRGTYPNPQEFPTYVSKVIGDAMRIFGDNVKEAISQNDLDTLLDCCKYWEKEYPGARIEKTVREISGDKYGKMMRSRLLTVPPYTPYLDFAGQDWDKLFKVGLNGMIAEARERIAALEREPGSAANDKIKWYQAVIMSMQAVIAWAARYSRLAKAQAAGEKDPARRAELEKIAAVCERVPADPPRSFHEAVQFHWFIALALELEKNNRFMVPLGRPDQYLRPYYEKDIREGRITYDEAGELLGFLLVKGLGVEYFAADFTENLMVTIAGYKPQFTTGSYGYTYVIGGVDRQGRDASNELSVLFIEALRQVKVHMPYVHLRYHRAMAPELVDRAILCNSAGGGQPAWFNDRHGTELLLEMGMPIEEARDWTLCGCAFLTHPASSGSAIVGGWFNHPKIFEMALNNGVDPVTGEQLGPRTGDPRDFKTFDQMLDAYNKQFEHVLDLVVRVHNATWTTGIEDASYLPFSSACIVGQLETGVDATRFSRYPAVDSIEFVDRGHNDVGDCLTAIKKLVFDEKKIAMRQLLDALKADFEGYEEVRQMCAAAPKYCDDDEADAMVSLVWNNATERIQRYRTAHGQRFRISRQGASWGQWAGQTVGALPNGRKAKTPLYDAAGSPTQGGGRKGLTSVFNSVAMCCDPAHAEGPVVNQRLAPIALKTRAGRDKLAAAIAGYFDRPSYHMQFNVFDKEMLLDAQRRPENYRDLVIRVAGYSAFWVELSPEVQNDILMRTEQGV